MTTAQLLETSNNHVLDDPTRGIERPSRISFRQPVSSGGFIDAAWWPYTCDLTAELPPLMDVVWTAGREINRITYHLRAWNPAPRRMQIEGRVVRLGGFTVGDPHTVTLSDAWGRERIDILVIAPDTDAAVARRIFDIASQTDGSSRAQQILDQVNAAAGRP